MFGFIADILTSITSILFPIFASYKALRTSDPAVLTPWLMYWTTLSLFLLVESQLHFLLAWIPFYSWMRFGLHLYLVLPGKQGSVFIYQEYIHPFLEEHERQIDRMISSGHARAKEAGLDAVKNLIDYVRVQILGGAPKAEEETTPQPSRNVSYSTYLMDRFAMPSARQGLAAAGTTDVFNLIGKALQQTTYPTSTTREAQADDLAQSGTLIPPSLYGEERTDFITTQRERLRTLLQAFDQEAYEAPDSTYPSSAQQQPRPSSSMPRQQPSSRKPPYLATTPGEDTGAGAGAGYNNMHKSRSESEFEDLAYESMSMPDPEAFRPPYPTAGERAASSSSGGARPLSSASAAKVNPGGGWSNWIWGSYGEKDSVVDPKKNE